MKNRIIYFALVLLFFVNQANSKNSSDLSELNPSLRKTVSWKLPDLNKEVPLKIYYLEESTGDEARDAVIYVTNKAWERIGKEDDLSILRDLIKQKFIVITMDLGNDKKAVSPFIDNDINGVYNAVFGFKTNSLLKEINLKPREFRCFVLPGGYRVAADLTYWEIDKHGVHGTLEYILNSYNKEIVPKVKGMKPASKPSEMVDRKGNPFDYRIKMDIIYPSQSKKKLPAFVYSETQASRNPHGGLTADGSHLNWYQLRGYVYVVMGHCFNPCVTHYWHFGNFTLDHWNGLACYSAAMRYINKNADQYSINADHIGMMGISKGQIAVTRLSDPNHASTKENSKFKGFPECTPEPQPWQGYPSKIHAGWQGMGAGLWETEFVTRDYVPTILACGENDRDVITKEGTPSFLKKLQEYDLNHLNLFMEGLGHSLSYGYDKRLGVDRYKLVMDFFDRYLKVEDKLPPAVLLVTPKDSAVNVNPESEISVNFAPAIDEKTVGNKGLKLISLPGKKEVKGQWKMSCQGTKYTFVSDQSLPKGRYQIEITPKIRDRRGIPLKTRRNIEFTVGT